MPNKFCVTVIVTVELLFDEKYEGNTKEVVPNLG